MAHSTVALFLGSTTWRLCRDGDEVAQLATGDWHADEAASAAEVIAEAILECEPRVQRSLEILLDASLCLPAPLEFTSPKQLRNREMMLYELEEWLPVAAEDVVADFARQGRSALAVAARTDSISDLVEKLSVRAVSIRFVAPAVLVAVQAHLAQSTKHPIAGALWVSEEGAGDLLILEGGRPKDWVHFPDVFGELQAELAFRTLKEGKDFPITAYVATEQQKTSLNLLRSVTFTETVVSGPMPLEKQALAALEPLRAGRAEPLLQLTSGWSQNRVILRPLRRDWAVLQLTGILLLGSLVWFNARQAIAVRDATAQLQASQEDVFREVFPDARLPRGIRTRLESELKKLSGARGGENERLGEQSSLPILHQLLSALPREMRFRLLEIRVGPQRIDLTGEVREYTDADKLANSLRAQGLLVKPPTSQRLPEQGVSFRLVADAKPAEHGVDDKIKKGERDAS